MSSGLSDSPFVQVVRISGWCERVATIQAQTPLLVQCDDVLYALREADLISAATRLTEVDLAVLPGTRVLASEIAGENAWAVSAGRGTVAALKGSQVTLIPLADLRQHREIEIVGFPAEAQAICLDEGESLLLCQTFSQRDPDFGQFDLLCLDLERRAMISQRTISSIDPLDAVWLAELQSFLIHDFQRGRLWRWSPVTSEPHIVDETGPGGLQLAGFAFDAPRRVVTEFLDDFRAGRWQLVRGEVTGNTVMWGTPLSLPEGEYESMIWHPNGEVFACIRTIRREVRLSVMDTSGRVVGECNLPAACQGNGLAWSGDGQKVYACGTQAIGICRVSY